MISLET